MKDLEVMQKLMNDNIEKLYSCNFYLSLMNRANNLNGFDTLSRLLILLQRPDATSVKSDVWWFQFGREVEYGAKPLKVAIPIYQQEYIDASSGELVSVRDLTTQQIQYALSRKILSKKLTLNSVDIQEVYDIKDTYASIDTDRQLETEPDRIKEALKSFGCGNIDELAEQLFIYFIEAVLTFLHISPKLVYQYKNLVLMSLKYSLSSLSTHDNAGYTDKLIYELNLVEFDSSEELFSILQVVDSMIYILLRLNETDEKQESVEKDNLESLDKLHRAEILLDILQANYIRTKILNGGQDG